jgi:hypothetical protein
MKIFLSGWQASNAERELAVIKAGAVRERCYSFAMVQKLPGLPFYVKGLEEALQVSIDNKIDIMMDSGVVSWRSYRVGREKIGDKKALDKLVGEHEFIDMYVKYVKANYKKWEFYVTIDLERNAPSILERHKRICAMGIKPVPVFHGDSSAEYIKKYADLGHDLVSIATWPSLRTGKEQFKKYFDACFAVAAKCNVRLHGLAQTSPFKMIDYPWYSVDSSSWSRVAGYGGIIMFDEHKQRMSNFHISERHSAGKAADAKLNPRTMRMVKEYVEANGYDFEQLRTDFVTRHIWNGKTMLKLADHAAKRHRNKESGRWNLLF